jgi:tetratricopeptide (TPR) repeat protein
MAGLWSNYGLALSTLGQFEQAEQAMGHALALATRWLGPRHPRVASIQLKIVYAHLQQKRVDEALPLAQVALTTYEQVQGPEGQDVGLALLFIGHLHLVRQEYALAQEKMERSVAVTRKAFGPDSWMMASPLAGLGRILSEQGQHTEALPYLQQALRVQTQQSGPNHLQLAEPLYTLGKSQLALGQAAQAIASFERVLRLENIEKSGVPVLADARFALAQVLAERSGEGERARELAHKAREFYARFAWHAPEQAEVEAWLAKLPPAVAPMK